MKNINFFVIQIQMVCLTKAAFVPGWAGVPKARHPCSSHYLQVFALVAGCLCCFYTFETSSEHELLKWQLHSDMDHISTYMRDILHWLPARQRIGYRMAALVWRCLLGLATAYLVEFCGPTQSARSSLSLRSADQGLLRVPFARTSAMQKRDFAVVGPSVWNGLPLSIRSLPRNLSQL